MTFIVGAITIYFIAACLFIWAVLAFGDNEKVGAGILAAITLVAIIAASWLQTHRIIPTQHVGISRSTVSQELRGLYPSGVVSKPFLGSVYQFPASSSYERCEQYTPAIKGSYGISIDLCFYYDAGNVDWLAEVNRTGSLDAGSIMNVWRNSIVGDVARSVKEYTPEALSDNRAEVERAIFDNVNHWFAERGIPLTRVSFKNWVFTSPDVAKSFDTSIVSQRKITEQIALLEAAKISRQREKYEAETSKMVSEWQKQALDVLGLEGREAVDYLWIKMMTEQGEIPDVVILGTSNTPVSIPMVDRIVPPSDSETSQ